MFFQHCFIAAVLQPEKSPHLFTDLVTRCPPIALAHHCRHVTDKIIKGNDDHFRAFQDGVVLWVSGPELTKYVQAPDDSKMATVPAGTFWNGKDDDSTASTELDYVSTVSTSSTVHASTIASSPMLGCLPTQACPPTQACSPTQPCFSPSQPKSTSTSPTRPPSTPAIPRMHHTCMVLI